MFKLLAALLIACPAAASAQQLTCYRPAGAPYWAPPRCGYFNGAPPALQRKLNQIMRNGPGTWQGSVGTLHSHGSPWNQLYDSGRPFPLNHYSGNDFYSGSNGADMSSGD